MARVLRRALVPGLLAGLLLPAAPARAETPPRPRLSIVELGAAATLGGLGTKLTKLVADQAAADARYEVRAADESKKLLGADGLKALHACKGAVECVVAAAAPLGERVVTGSLDRTSDAYLVKLWLFDVPAKAVVASVDRKIPIAARRLEKDVAEAIPALLAGEVERLGTVRIEVAIAGATVSVDGAPEVPAPHVFRGKPGQHTLKVVAPGYFPVERLLNVEPGAETVLPVELAPLPGVAGPTAANATTSVEQVGAPSPLPLGTWIAGGTAVAAAGTGLVFGLLASSLESDGAAGDDGVSGITRQQAFEGQRDALLANVCFGVAGAAALAGVAFWYFDDGAPAGPQVAATVSPAGFSLLGSF